MRTSRSQCFLRWRWTVLSHNRWNLRAASWCAAEMCKLGGVAYGEQFDSETGCNWRGRGSYAGGGEQKGIPLRGRTKGWRVGDEPVWLDLRETVFEQHGDSKRGVAFRQG